MKGSNSFTPKAFDLTTELLDLNPELYTVWNYRRDIISKGDFLQDDLYRKELKFVFEQLVRYPKCYWIWNHRVWILEQLNQQKSWVSELQIVEKLLSADARNFHGWQYRRIIISRLVGFSSSLEEKLLLYEKEFDYTTEKIESNFSNFSAWHNRSQLILKLFEIDLRKRDIFTSKSAFLQNELLLLKNAMYTDPDDSSVWTSMSWLLTTEFIRKDLSDRQYLDLITCQLKEIEQLNELELADNGKDNKWCLKTIAWLQRFIGKPNKEVLTKLSEIDTLRKGRYSDIITSAGVL